MLKKFSFAPLARRKMVNFLHSAPKTCQLFKVLMVLPPSGKNSAGVHANRSLLLFENTMYMYVVICVALHANRIVYLRYLLLHRCHR